MSHPGPSPSVTVIMANFNGARWIGDAIRSVQAQSLRDWELIVVDDASADTSVEVVRAAADSDPRVSLLTSRANAGPSVARNRALARARGRWVTCLDSDDLLGKDRLQALVDRAEADGARIAADDLLIMDERGALTGHSLLGLPAATTYDAVGLVETLYLGYLKPIIRAELLAGVRYDERMRTGEDFDFLLRAMAADDTCMAVYPPMGYHYRRWQGSLSTDRSVERIALLAMLEANARFLAAHPMPARLARACRRRHASLQASLHWVDVTQDIRQRRFASAIRRTIVHPDVLGRAMAFFTKRVRRLASSRRATTLGL